jgi:hypothetical protein
MSIPFNQQRLQLDFVTTIRTEQASGKAVPGADLLCAVEQRMGPLPEALRELFSAFSIPAAKRPGRPAGSSAHEDFGLEELDERYTTLLRQFQSEKRSRTTREKTTPSERAYRVLATEFKDVFGNIDWLSLRNKHSSWKTGRFYPADSVVDSENFDAEIERQFPAHK